MQGRKPRLAFTILTTQFPESIQNILKPLETTTDPNLVPSLQASYCLHQISIRFKTLKQGFNQRPQEQWKKAP